MMLKNGLHDKAWRAVEKLELEAIKEPEGYLLILEALAELEKRPIVRNAKAFEDFFKHSNRRKGQEMEEYNREKTRKWG